MKQEYVMGNGAIALGALAAGVGLVSGYPGTPSSEIIETIAGHPHENVHLIVNDDVTPVLPVVNALLACRR